MENVKIIIEACIRILNTQINLFEYSITLSSVILFYCIGSLILFFIFRLFK